MTELKEKSSSGLSDDIKDMSFEMAMNELESLVRRLEEGKLNLEDAIGAYERGMALRSHCETKLRAAKLKVEQVLKDQEPATSPQGPREE
ncbi:MAG: exodeoxyribonuclease VII small subunit [Alphaproteobacteria bacterium]|nr:exodeoxyribonuclease VII small subunit [Alphaproteobacteria bacterium]